MDFEYLWWRRVHNPSAEPVAVLSHPPSKNVCIETSLSFFRLNSPSSPAFSHRRDVSVPWTSLCFAGLSSVSMPLLYWGVQDWTQYSRCDCEFKTVIVEKLKDNSCYKEACSHTSFKVWVAMSSDQVAQGFFQSGLENLQGQRLHSFPMCVVLQFACPQEGKGFLYIQFELLLSQLTFFLFFQVLRWLLSLSPCSLGWVNPALWASHRASASACDHLSDLLLNFLQFIHVFAVSRLENWMQCLGSV